MRAHLYLHLRRLASGRVIATPVPLCWLSTDGADEATARAEVTREVRNHIAEDTDGSTRAMYEERPAAALDTVTVEYGPKKGPQLEVTFGIVVLTRESASGPVHMAYVPEVPRLLVWGREPDEVHRRARKAIERDIADWYASTVIASEERGEVSLEPLEVEIAESHRRATTTTSRSCPPSTT